MWINLANISDWIETRTANEKSKLIIFANIEIDIDTDIYVFPLNIPYRLHTAIVLCPY